MKISTCHFRVLIQIDQGKIISAETVKIQLQTSSREEIQLQFSHINEHHLKKPQLFKHENNGL